MVIDNPLLNKDIFRSIVNPGDCPDCGMATHHMTYLDAVNHIFNCFEIPEVDLTLSQIPLEVANKKLDSPLLSKESGG